MTRIAFASNNINPKRSDGLPDELAKKLHFYALNEHAKVLEQNGEIGPALNTYYEAQQILSGNKKPPKKSGKAFNPKNRSGSLYPKLYLAGMIDTVKRRLGL